MKTVIATSKVNWVTTSDCVITQEGREREAEKDRANGANHEDAGKGASGSKNRPHDAYPVRCRVPGYYEPCLCLST